MGATAFMHPQSWITARELVLDRLTTPGSDALNESQISVGVAINNNKLCGCVDSGRWMWGAQNDV